MVGNLSSLKGPVLLVSLVTDEPIWWKFSEYYLPPSNRWDCLHSTGCSCSILLKKRFPFHLAIDYSVFVHIHELVTSKSWTRLKQLSMQEVQCNRSILTFKEWHRFNLVRSGSFQGTRGRAISIVGILGRLNLSVFCSVVLRLLLFEVKIVKSFIFSKFQNRCFWWYYFKGLG